MLARTRLLATFVALSLFTIPVYGSSLSRGCGRAPSLTTGYHKMSVNGEVREFHTTLPENYDTNTPYRLIFCFHFLGSNMTEIVTGAWVETGTYAYYGLQRLANNSAIFVAPQGTVPGWPNIQGKDIAFTAALTEALEADLCVNPNLVFATGWSYGAGMTFSVGCSLADKFRAGVAIGGAEVSGCDGGKDSFAYMGVHGVQDGVLVIEKGRKMRDRWVAVNGCQVPSAVPEPPPGSLTHILTEYSGCSDHPVWWLAFDGNHTAAPYDGGIGDSATKSYVPPETWRFFTQFG
ncbi:alpha/beta hydrolase family esterase [Aspergillus affinis]|uniref:alpha/beta hydrolase family esterase n=1 Tax=Aspergillus affinis TaxID=1070780 RepID=UPI0022FE8777|nr:hydrolase [Aspergillus affinis]KAI9035535.1 hydrolase [Aspergillus affinis]